MAEKKRPRRSASGRDEKPPAWEVLTPPADTQEKPVQGLFERSWEALESRVLDNQDNSSRTVWAGGPGLESLESVKYVLRAEMLGTVKLSRETKRRLLALLPPLKTGREHPKVRRKKRRERYLRSERASKLRRDAWMTSTPEGLWFYYKNRKGSLWCIEKQAFVDILNTVVDVDRQLQLYRLLFSIYRVDSSKSFTVENIVFVDRYNSTLLYIQ